MKRAPFITRTIRLIGPQQRETALAVIGAAPLDPDKPLEMIVREEKKGRKLDQNAAMWSGPLRDIEEQAWVEGRRYAAETWHELFKRMYLPEDDAPDLGALVKDGYRKWDIDPSGERVLIGSTTQLTVRGMAIYMEQICAHGAKLGVVYHAVERAA